MSLFTNAQNPSLECFLKVSKIYKQEKNFEKALLLLKTCPDSIGFFNSINRGNIYYEMGKYDSAVLNLKLGLTRNNGLSGFESAYITLTDAYIKLGQFDNAGTTLAQNAIKNKRSELFHAFGQFLKRTYRVAQIFVGKGFKDSAILVLTPYMFKGNDFGVERVEAEEIADYYLRLLKEKYGLPKVRRKIKQAIRRISFSNKVDTSKLFFKSPTLPCYCAAEYHIVLWGKRIPFKEGLQSSQMINDSCTCPEKYTLQYAISRIKQSYLYRQAHKKS